MSFFYIHRFWMATLAFALVLIFTSTPVLGFLRNEAVQHFVDMKASRQAAKQALERLEQDVAMTEKLSGQIDTADMEKSLAPVDRLQAADMLEKLAVATRLSHFTYTLSAEQKQVIQTLDAGPQELALSTINIKADMTVDTDVWIYIQKLQSSMPGRLRPQEIALERIGAPNAPPAANNIHLTASFEWLSNGAAKEMAEGR